MINNDWHRLAWWQLPSALALTVTFFVLHLDSVLFRSPDLMARKIVFGAFFNPIQIALQSGFVKPFGSVLPVQVSNAVLFTSSAGLLLLLLTIVIPLFAKMRLCNS